MTPVTGTKLKQRKTAREEEQHLGENGALGPALVM